MGGNNILNGLHCEYLDRFEKLKGWMCLNLVVWLVVSLRCGEKSERFRIGADPAEFYIVAWRGKVGRSERPTKDRRNKG